MRFLALLAAATLASAATSPRNPKIDRTLWSLLESNQPVDAMIKLKEQSQPVVETSDVKDPAERIRNKLVAATSKSAAMVKSLLTPRSRRLDATQCPGSATSSYLWIAGRMHIKGLTLCMAQEIAASESVLRLRKEEVEEIDTSAIAQASPVDTLPELWAANMIRAPAVWSSGNTGQDIVIGSIDTGVRATHSLYVSKLRPDYNWFDRINNTATPTDDSGHGSHVMGILVGDLGVGIAPGAQWISCRGCGATCDESVLLSCMQFMLCPTDAQGNNADCSKKPHVINNSWGSSVTKTAYLSAFQAWEDAGILAVTSAGNAGPLCSSFGSPADYPTALAVGMMTQDFLLNSRTSRGPPKNDSNVIKPDISAPGWAIYSASNAGDKLYASLSGTSQAAPHVAGTAALMLAANPSLTPAQIRTALKTHVETAWIILGVGGQNCGGVDDLTFPNNNFGAGLVNASFAVESVATSSPLPAPTTSSPTPATTQGPTDAPTTQVPVPTATTGSPSTAPVSTTKAPTTTSTTRVPTSTATTTKTPTTTATTQKPTTTIKPPTTTTTTKTPTSTANCR